MPRIPGIRRVFHRGLTRDRVEDEVDAELAFHFEMTMDELVRGGMSPDAARREAERRFGDLGRHRHTLTQIDHGRVVRADWTEWWHGMAQDLRYALRGIVHNPGFSIAAILTLALGIGANAAMFGIVDRLLLAAPAHVREPQNVVRIYFNTERPGRPGQPAVVSDVTSYPKFVAMRDNNRTFESLAAHADQEATLREGGEIRPINVSLASAEFFPTLGVRPALGRFFTAEEERGGERVAVISYGMWRGTFGTDPSVLGKPLRIAQSTFTVIGVAPRGFGGLRLIAPDVWVPLAAAGEPLISSQWKERGWFFLTLVGRLRPGATREQAATELASAWRRDGEANADERKATMIIGSVIADRGPLRSKESVVAAWLAGVSVLVLLIACANIANLLLARALKRRKEIAVRLALGAGRGRLVRQLLTESLLLAILGGGAALVLARWGGDAMRSLLLPNISWEGSPVGARVLWFTAAMALVAGVIAGLVPAVQASRPDLLSSLKSGTREGLVTRWRTRRTLLLAQAALSVVLLVGAGLFVRSLRNVRAVDVGFDAERVVSLQFDFSGLGVLGSASEEIYTRVLERVRRMPGVEGAALSMTSPFRTTIISDLYVPGLDSVPRQDGLLPVNNAVGPDYFTTMGIRILRGRAITAEDRVGTELAIVVNDAMARAVWPNENALGKCVKVDADTVPCSTVVGIAENARHNSLGGEPPMQYYVALNQGAGVVKLRTLFIRPTGDPAAFIPMLRAELKALGSDLPYADIHRMEEFVAPELRPWRLGATMFGVFGLLALAVAAVGLYSVIAYNVAQRTHEMGVRVALGASRADIVRMVVRDGVRVALVGVAIGAAVALWAVKFAQPLLFDVSPRDPLVFGTVVLTLTMVAIAASGIPALRAARVEPGTALKVE
ncbi:MAG TPA: ABC transporter permease [Gemmatimonadaceae bacterium]|nr:ABC transporter permease [Gemmatimonadaceae bacterium]